MARKKAEPIPQEEPEMMEQGLPDGADVTEQDIGAESVPAEPEATLFPELSEGLFPPDGTTYMPPEAYDSGTARETETDAESGDLSASHAEENSESAAEAAEGYGELLTELSTTVPENGEAPEAEPLMLPETEGKSPTTMDAGADGEELSAADRLLLEEENGEGEQGNGPSASPPMFPPFSGQRRNG